MRELLKSMMSFSWAMSLFGMRQMEKMLNQPDSAAKSFDSVARAAETELGPSVKTVYQSGDRMQREMVDTMLSAMPASQPSSGPSPSPASAAPPQPQLLKADSGRLDTRAFVVLGEGLAAGMGDFALSEETQPDSFPAQMARQMQASFSQPLIQAPGIGNAVGFAALPVRIPAPMQTTVLEDRPETPFSNLSVPGFTAADAVHLRPVQPLVHRDDAKQTAANLILGALAIAHGQEDPLPTQLECALKRSPSLALIALGYHEALEAAINGDPGLLPDAGSFRAHCARMVSALREVGAEVLLLTSPDPLDTAHFSTLETAARILKVDPAALYSIYGLSGGDLLSLNGLNEISVQFFGKAIAALPAGSVLSAETARRVSADIDERNREIVSLAREQGALVYDLHGLFRRVASSGIAVGSKVLTAEYLGGFYGLNGYYPGSTGHAIIANELLQVLNAHYGARFAPIDANAVIITDPAADCRQASGPNWTTEQLMAAGQPHLSIANFESPAEVRHSYSYSSEAVKPLAPLNAEMYRRPLRLPDGLEQVLPLNKETSYFGDGLQPMNCRSEKTVQWGSCGSFIFGGLAMVDSHLSGSIRIRFSPPVANVTNFQIFYEGGFTGDDAMLLAPQFFKMPFQQNRVDEVPGLVSSGVLDLVTGYVSELQVYAAYRSTALFALVSMNPNFPKLPLTFPGQYGSAWAQFEQRPDGKLDFSFYGSTFVPLGKDIRWPLNFAGPSLQFATIPANGTTMHPHLSLSTKELETMDATECPEIPFNTLQEYTLFTHNSAFGDKFTLDVPHLGGPATGRSHLLGRLQIQFGGRTGNSVPIAVTGLNPGGYLNEFAASPLSAVFPGRLAPGPHGFDEILRFPQRTYSLYDLGILGDPFDLSIGAVDLRTGKLLAELLHRGFINQDLIFALIRVEPRTPQSSFFFRGPAVLQRNPAGQPVFRFQGTVRIPYPEGFNFPTPNLATSFVVGPNSVLDPFLWFRAIQDAEPSRASAEGYAQDVISSTGERFSYSYSLWRSEERWEGSLSYENHTQMGSFRMHSLAWVGFGNSLTSQSDSDEFDTITFTGFGIWRKDGTESLQQASVQISRAPGASYFGIQINGADVSGVNTKPPNIEDALP